MMDYYKVLGLGREASKEEIKDAFRKLALKFHPDRHAKSSTAVQDDSMRRFKEVSEAYDVLSDDKKRTAYNYGTTGFHSGWNGSARGSGSGSCSGSGYYRGGGYSTYQRRAASRNWGFRFGSSLLYFSTMDFLLHAVLAGIFFGGLFVADATGKALWQRQNTGKSFEETVNALNQTKGERSSSTQKVKDSDET